MKRIILLCLFLLLPFICRAEVTVVVGQTVAAAPACSTYDSATADPTETTEYISVSRYTTGAYFGVWVDENVSNICQIDFYIYETEAGSFSGRYMIAMIYDVSGTAITTPSAPIAYSDMLDLTTIGATFPGNAYSFTFTPTNVTNDGHVIVMTQLKNMDVGDGSWTASGADSGSYYYDTTQSYTPDIVFFEGIPLVKGTAGSLENGQWCFSDQDTIGQNRIYIQLAAGDPDNESAGDIKVNDIDGSIFTKSAYADVDGGDILDGGFSGYVAFQTGGVRQTYGGTTQDIYYEVYAQ